MGKQDLCLCQGSATEQPWCGLMPGKDRVLCPGVWLCLSAPMVSGCVPLGTRGL